MVSGSSYFNVRGGPVAPSFDARKAVVLDDRWLALMHDAMVEQELTDEQESQLWMYLIQAAFAMQNVPDEPFGQSLPTETTR